jgi:predicted DNA-binding protein
MFCHTSRIDNIQDFSLADKVLETLKDAYNILKASKPINYYAKQGFL